LTEKVIVARESLVLGNNFSLFEENSWLFMIIMENFDKIQLFRSRLFFLGQVLYIKYGASATVLEPVELSKKIKQIRQKTLENYKQP